MSSAVKSPRKRPPAATKPPREPKQLTEHEANVKIVTAWLLDMGRFVDEAILAPYNAATGSNYHQSEQQRDASSELTKLVKAKEAGKSGEILGLSIMSGTGTGKDAFASWAILWFMTCFPYPKIPCVSVSADQLNKVLWSEMSEWLMHSLLKAQFKLQNDKLYMMEVPDEVRGKRWMAFPKAANPKQSKESQVEGLGGIHEKYLLQVVDECSGVLRPVFDVLERNQTEPVNLMLLIFNPLRAKCYAVDTQYADSDRWVTRRWNAEESELVDRASIAAKLKKYGRDSNPYRVGVLGLPPIVDESTLIPMDWIMDAVDRPVEVRETDPLIKGVDCGAGGDESIIATRRGPKVYPFKNLKTPDAQILENWIGTDIDAEKPDVVRIDVVGIGWAVEANVRQKKGAIVEAADGRRTADEQERYFNKRAECYCRLRDLFQLGSISIPDDPDLIDELGATRCEFVRLKNNTVTKIIDKKKIKDDLGHSPDKADALSMTYYYPDAMASLKSAPSRRRRVETPSPAAWLGA